MEESKANGKPAIKEHERRHSTLNDKPMENPKKARRWQTMNEIHHHHHHHSTSSLQPPHHHHHRSDSKSSALQEDKERDARKHRRVREASSNSTKERKKERKGRHSESRLREKQMDGEKKEHEHHHHHHEHDEAQKERKKSSKSKRNTLSNQDDEGSRVGSRLRASPSEVPNIQPTIKEEEDSDGKEDIRNEEVVNVIEELKRGDGEVSEVVEEIKELKIEKKEETKKFEDLKNGERRRYSTPLMEPPMPWESVSIPLLFSSFFFFTTSLFTSHPSPFIRTYSHTSLTHMQFANIPPSQINRRRISV